MTIALSATPPSAERPIRLRAVAFDIIETVFPLEPLRDDLVALGLPPTALETWFATALRDAFALAAAEDFAPFSRVLAGALQQIVALHVPDLDPDRQAAIVARMADLPCRADAAAAFALLRDNGIAVIALSNGAATTTDKLLERAKLDRFVERVVSVDEVRRSKPAKAVYQHAAGMAGVDVSQAGLIAVHPWDINGAAAAGMATGYVSLGRPFPDVMRAPDVSGAGLLDTARALLARAAIS